MGGIFSGLVPAAILLDNPGITLDGLKRKLRYVGPFHVYKGIRDEGIDISSLSSGMNNPDFFVYYCFYFPYNKKLFDCDPKDPLQIPRLRYLPRANDHQWKSPLYRTTFFRGFVEEDDEKVPSTFSNHTFKQGERLSRINIKIENYCYFNGKRVCLGSYPSRNNFFRVRKVLRQKRLAHNKWELTLVIARLIPEYDIEDHNNLAALVRKYPEFHPDDLFNTSPEKGWLKVGDPFFTRLRWFREGEKYYLDGSSYLEHDEGEYLYSSTMLTSEAIKRKNWKILGYGSGDHHRLWDTEFMVNHPSVIIRRANALLEYWHAKSAKERGLTIFDWLRERAVNPGLKGLNKEAGRREIEIARVALKPILPGLREEVRRRDKSDLEAIMSFPKKGDKPF